MSKYIAMIFINDENDEFSEDEIKEQVKENMLEYADNAPFSIQGLIVKKAPLDIKTLF